MVNQRTTVERFQNSPLLSVKVPLLVSNIEGFNAAIKRNEILPFATTWMELEGIMLSEISQSEKDNYHMISLI